MEGRCQMTMIGPKPETKSWPFGSLGARTVTTKGTYVICETHILTEVTITPVPSTKPTTFYADAKLKHRLRFSKGMACHSPRMDNGWTCPMFAVTAVSRWGTMRIRLNAQITRQTLAKPTIKTKRTTQEPHQEEMV